MITIDSLPVEVLEVIFQHLDGHSLVTSSRVCKKWHRIFQNVEKQAFWQHACKREVNQTVLEELCGFRNLETISNSLVWKTAYSTWARGCLVNHFKFWTKRFSGHVSPLTCLKASGSWVLSGHDDGSVLAWNQLTGKFHHVVTHHLKIVNDIIFVDILHAGPYGSIENPWDHHHLISVSKDGRLHVRFLMESASNVCCDVQVPYYHSCSMEAIRVYESTAAVVTKDNTILVFSLEYVKHPEHSMNVRLVRTIIGPAELVQYFNLWRDEIQCMCSNGVLKTLSISTDEWRETDLRLGKKDVVSTFKAFIFRSRLIFFHSACGQLLVSVKGLPYKRYNLMQTIKCSIVSIAVHGSLLALGTETGRLLLYHIPNDLDLMNVNISKPSWSSYLNDSAIISIDILDDGISPVVVACTVSQIFVTKWYKKNCNSLTERSISSIFS